ncbi:hypothetical protein APHAL10511_007507 [Amanita phalloides]|nr:hypothetical protein APHAL10511_007507 [Amanita phalloides]
MPATRDSQSPLARDGGLGLWIQAGEWMAERSAGQRQSLLNSSSLQLPATSPTTLTSDYSETTGALLRGREGGGVGTTSSTTSLKGYTSWSETWESQYTQNMYHQRKTQQTHPPEGYTLHESSSYHLSSLVPPSITLSQTSTLMQTAWEKEAIVNSERATHQETGTQKTSESQETYLKRIASSSKLSRRVVILVNVGICSEEASSEVGS